MRGITDKEIVRYLEERGVNIAALRRIIASEKEIITEEEFEKRFSRVSKSIAKWEGGPRPIRGRKKDALEALVKVAKTGRDPAYGDIVKHTNLGYSSALQYCQALEAVGYIEIIKLGPRETIIKVLYDGEGKEFIPPVTKPSVHVDLDALGAQ